MVPLDVPSITLRAPVATDGLAVHRLIAACPPLDTNSVYCNLLQCTHFADTCAVAERDGRIVGFLSGYLLPQCPDTLFLWQFAVADEARGQGLAKRMLHHVLARPGNRDVRRIEATVTASNAASWGVFESFAREHDAAAARRPMFERDAHFGGEHDSEVLISIGPISPIHSTAATEDI